MKLKTCPLLLPAGPGMKNVYNGRDYACPTYAPTGVHLGIVLEIHDIFSEKDVDEIFDSIKLTLESYGRNERVGLINMEKRNGHHYNARLVIDDNGNKVDSRYRVWNYSNKDKQGEEK